MYIINHDFFEGCFPTLIILVKLWQHFQKSVLHFDVVKIEPKPTMEQVFPFHTKVFSGCNSGKLIETTGSNSPTDHHECKVKVDETKPFIEILMYESTEYKNNWPDKGLLKTVEKVEIHEEDIVLEEDADVKAIEGIGSPRCIKDEASDEWDKEIKLKIETSEVNYFKKVGEEKQIKKTDDVIGEVIKSEETEFELVEGRCDTCCLRWSSSR